MRYLRTLLAFGIIITVMLVSCVKNNGEGEASGKIDYIEMLRYDDGEAAGAHSKIVYTPTFDDQGRLVKSVEQWYFADHETGEMAGNQYYQTTIKYNENDHTVYFERGDGYWDYSAAKPGWTEVKVTDSGTLTCDEDWHATAWNDRRDYFTYTDGCLTVYTHDDLSDYWWAKHIYEWKDGDLQKLTKEKKDGTSYVAYSYTYTSDLNPFGNYDFLSSSLNGWIDGEFGLWAAGIFGNHSKHLLKTETEEENNIVTTYTYKKDKSGRITEVRRAEGGSLGGAIGGVLVIHWK
jgi:hypothetical protein